MKGSSCECGYSRKRKGARCKHIVAVEMHIMSQKESAASQARTVLCRAEVKCPNKKCKSGRIIGYGLRKHPYREPAQTYIYVNPTGSFPIFASSLSPYVRHLSS